MIRNESADEVEERRGRRLHAVARSREPEPRTIVVRHQGGWPALAVLAVCLLLIALALLGHLTLR